MHAPLHAMVKQAVEDFLRDWKDVGEFTEIETGKRNNRTRL
jgi:hypothetical protein